jgi:hypothetical protein
LAGQAQAQAQAPVEPALAGKAAPPPAVKVRLAAAFAPNLYGDSDLYQRWQDNMIKGLLAGQAVGSPAPPGFRDVNHSEDQDHRYITVVIRGNLEGPPLPHGCRLALLALLEPEQPGRSIVVGPGGVQPRFATWHHYQSADEESPIQTEGGPREARFVTLLGLRLRASDGSGAHQNDDQATEPPYEVVYQARASTFLQRDAPPVDRLIALIALGFQPPGTHQEVYDATINGLRDADYQPQLSPEARRSLMEGQTAEIGSALVRTTGQFYLTPAAMEADRSEGKGYSVSWKLGSVPALPFGQVQMPEAVENLSPANVVLLIVAGSLAVLTLLFVGITLLGARRSRRF